jgi:hypothetical protein
MYSVPYVVWGLFLFLMQGTIFIYFSIEVQFQIKFMLRAACRGLKLFFVAFFIVHLFHTQFNRYH